MISKNKETAEKNNDKGDFSVKFWGVRGSYPAPGEDTVKFGGNTPCIEIKNRNKSAKKNKHECIFLDAGTGFIKAGQEAAGMNAAKSCPEAVNILLSHVHWDHIMGLPYFALLQKENITINIYGMDEHIKSIKSLFARPFFPMNWSEVPADINFRSIKDGDRYSFAEDITVEAVSGNHSSRSLIYKVLAGDSECVYTGDFEHEFTRSDKECYGELEGHRNDNKENNTGLPASFSSGNMENEAGQGFQHKKNNSELLSTSDNCNKGMRNKLINFARGADLLIYDAHFLQREYEGGSEAESKKGWGHSTWQEGIKIAREAGAKRLAFFHHSPHRNDRELEQLEEKLAGEIKKVFAAREGMVINI